MSSKLLHRRIFYSYWDINGDGINPAYLSTYSDSVIFDTYNRTLYSYNGVFGNHQLGTYHGEIFNDFDNNNAAGDYSSASGSHVESKNAYEYGVGHYNESKEGKTIFTVGSGTSENDRSNAFEVHKTGVAYAHTAFDAPSAYFGYTDTTTLNVRKNAYVEGNAYVTHALYGQSAYFSYTEYENLVAKQAYFGYVGADTISSENAYAYQSYIDYDIWLDARSVRHSMQNQVRVFPLPDDKHQPDGFYHGTHYVWIGTNTDLPAPEERYANVFYIVVDEAPSTSLPAFDDDGWWDVVVAEDGDRTKFLFADDGNPEQSDNRVLRYD